MWYIIYHPVPRTEDSVNMVAESAPASAAAAAEADADSMTLDEQLLPTILLVKALKGVTLGAEVFNCSAEQPCQHLCKATLDKYGTRCAACGLFGSVTRRGGRGSDGGEVLLGGGGRLSEAVGVRQG